MLQCMKCKWCIFVREMFDTISNNSTLIIVSNVRDDLLLVPDKASTETILSHFIYMLLVSGESRGKVQMPWLCQPNLSSAAVFDHESSWSLWLLWSAASQMSKHVPVEKILDQARIQCCNNECRNAMSWGLIKSLFAAESHQTGYRHCHWHKCLSVSPILLLVLKHSFSIFHVCRHHLLLNLSYSTN